MQAALKVMVGEDHTIQLPHEVPVGEAELVVLFSPATPPPVAPGAGECGAGSRDGFTWRPILTFRCPTR